MLAHIRAFAKSPFATVLLGLLVVSFAVFGITDVFRNRVTKDAVVQADSRTIKGAEFKQMFDNYVKTLEQQNGGQSITTEQAVAAGADRGLANNLAESESFAALLTRMGVAPSDALVVAEIRKTPAFFDPVSGRFDRATYQGRLSQGHLTEADYERYLRDQIAQNQLIGGLSAGLTAPRTYLASVASYNREGRTFSWFTLQPGLAGPPAKPADADLAAYVKKNAARFTKPELRQLSFVRFSSGEIAKTVPINEADVQKRFDFQKDSLSLPETRSFVQVPVKDAAAGAQAVARLRRGEAPEAVAKALGGSTVSYVDAPKTAVSDRKIGEAAFGPAKAGDVLGPTQGVLGMAVIKLVKVSPGHQATLEEARAKIEGEVRKEAATDKVYQLVQKYEDARSGGATMVEAAKKAELPILPIPIPLTAQGTTLQGAKANIPPKVLQTAFSLPQSADSEVIDMGNGEYAAVRVDKVMPSALATIDEVRPALTQMFILDALQKALKAKAQEVIARINKGEPLAQVAASVGAKVETAADVQRSAAGRAFTNDLLGKVFAAKVGQTVTGDSNTLGLIVAKLDKVGSGPVQDLATQVEVQRDGFRSVLFNDISLGARNAARATIKPAIDYERARTALGLEAPAPATAGAKK